MNNIEKVQNEKVQKKKGRKKNSVNTKNVLNQTDLKNIIDYNIGNNIQLIIEEENNDTLLTEEIVNVPKKRGRKPKGGNLIVKQPESYVHNKTITNVILHLKCSSNDLNKYNDDINKLITNPHIYNPEIPPNILTYNDESTAFTYYNSINKQSIQPQPDSIEQNGFSENQQEIIETNFTPLTYNINNTAYNELYNMKNYDKNIELNNNNLNNNNLNANNIIFETNNDEISIKDINTKLKKLKINLYKNNLNDKKSACFWCTCDFDNQTCYIPKYEVDGCINGYGSFCRPECAVAYLMKEDIDDSMKFERYHLLNQVYSKIYNYKKNIKQAPNPYYLLDKFYGNLTIQEYRKLLKTNHMLLVIDKPITRILPELHEDNEDMMLNLYGSIKNSSQITSGANKTGVYKVKRQSEKPQGPTKSSIIRDNFCGL